MHSQNDCENNSFGDEEEVRRGMHDDITLIKTYKEALTKIKNIHRFAIDQQDGKLLKIVSSIKPHTEGKIAATMTIQKTLHHFWKF